MAAAPEEILSLGQALDTRVSSGRALLFILRFFVLVARTFYLAVVLVMDTVAMMKHHDQSNLEKSMCGSSSKEVRIDIQVGREPGGRS